MLEFSVPLDFEIKSPRALRALRAQPLSLRQSIRIDASRYFNFIQLQFKLYGCYSKVKYSSSCHSIQSAYTKRAKQLSRYSRSINECAAKKNILTKMLFSVPSCREPSVTFWQAIYRISRTQAYSDATSQFHVGSNRNTERNLSFSEFTFYFYSRRKSHLPCFTKSTKLLHTQTRSNLLIID